MLQPDNWGAIRASTISLYVDLARRMLLHYSFCHFISSKADCKNANTTIFKIAQTFVVSSNYVSWKKLEPFSGGEGANFNLYKRERGRKTLLFIFFCKKEYLHKKTVKSKCSLTYEKKRSGRLNSLFPFFPNLSDR